MKTEWHVVDDWARARLDAARQKLEGPLDPVESAHTRGRIAALKELIALPAALQSAKESQSLNGDPDY